MQGRANAGTAWSDPARGLSADLTGRGPVSHPSQGFREAGLSGALAWDGRPESARGPNLTLSQSVGAEASGGMDKPLERDTLAGLAANPGSGFGAGAKRVAGEAGITKQAAEAAVGTAACIAAVRQCVVRCIT